MSTGPTPSSWNRFIRLMKIGRPSKWIFISALVLSLFETAASLIVPLFTKSLVDQISGAGIEMSLIFLLLAAFIVQAVTGGFSYYLMTYIGETFVAKIRKALWNHVLELPVPFFDSHQSGETMSRITQDTNTVKTLITNHLVTFVSGIVTILGSIIILLTIDWSMTVIMFVAVPVSLIILMPLGRKMHAISRQTQDEMADFSGNLGRVLSEIRLVKSYNGQPVERESGRKGIQNLFQFGLKEAKIQAVVSPFMTTIMMVVLVVIIGYGGARVSAGALSAGSLVAIIIYMFQIIVPFTQMATFFTAFQKASGATERIQELLDEDAEESEDGLKKFFSEEKLIFEDVSFGYTDNRQILDSLSFEISKGRTGAFVGPSGGGKTTIFSLIERFYPLSSGDIKLGNTSIKNIPLQEWRGAIGYVSQESPIMSGTIFENICYGLQREVKDEEVFDAARQANAYEFIMNLTDGFQTQVGERGVKLSGGQRQRIAIARALLRDPKILLLDEATSNLDSESELLVQIALKNLMKGRTTLIIAHRLSTVVEADTIFVIESGTISGSGTHQELLQTNELYSKLVQQQLAAEK
ncbi:ABC transporter ATP-binding protein [Bacillus salacetis]|uniref:ABC transporter ATP-binding protein n=1 Tax=Bacillus salacetis TaxID=2315464 RepID=A0A3A1R5I2_9BACI|nr:ABC transporter ATP-binding protein [Bacillus salacetis]RIW38409.1 ABC transporter ATP-binding protein [Bacillus salacetis]